MSRLQASSIWVPRCLALMTWRSAASGKSGRRPASSAICDQERTCRPSTKYRWWMGSKRMSGLRGWVSIGIHLIQVAAEGRAQCFVLGHGELADRADSQVLHQRDGIPASDLHCSSELLQLLPAYD